ncbi:transglycosylase associated protein, putative [Bradyrhizobium oligotrophicum S58]|uniref:Transglycosylase associated protein, putative n=1 Tax=Bradyrhizobium oligotrophicum S58 TaxID=1245469 RepID=M4ZN25_9BRAD|nr:GlsB/YeaQ/YmgE family stress response membrane protein [Bradyrhizobium oligotrophicum]BAM87595.1 transglycosylase associated protein, putative [Bradyrhizobium oligotrophicum S58]
MFTIAHAATWLVVGLVGGSLAGMLVKGRKAGFGLLANIGLGCVGAVIGGALFAMFGLFPGLDSIVISLRDVVAAFAGSLVVLAAIWLWSARAAS